MKHASSLIPTEYLPRNRVAMHEAEVDATKRLVAECRAHLEVIEALPMRAAEKSEDVREVHADNAYIEIRHDMAQEAVLRALGILRGAELRLDALTDKSEEARGAPGCTCGAPPFAPPEPSPDCPYHGG